MISWGLVLEHLIEACPEITDVFGPEAIVDLTLKGTITYLYEEEKLSLRQIAELTNGECSACSLGTKMKELGIELRSKGGPNYTKPFTISKKEYENLSYKRLALRYNVHIATIRNRCKKYIEEGGKKKKG